MGALVPVLQAIECYYDFAKDGGAVGDITLRGGRLPIGSTVVSGVVTVQTDATSAGSATVALKITTAGDILAATAVADVDTPGLAVVPVVTDPSTWIVTTTAGQRVTASIAVAALTAGKFKVKLFFVVND